MNEHRGPNEPTEITIDYTFFKKIYIVSKKHILDQDQDQDQDQDHVSKYFTHVQIDIVDFFDNNNTNDNGDDNGDDNGMFLEYIDAFDTTKIQMDMSMVMDKILLETSFMDTDEEDSTSVTTTMTHEYAGAGADVDANSSETHSMAQSKKKYVMRNHIKKKRKKECYEKKNNENIKKNYNTDIALTTTTIPIPTTTTPITTTTTPITTTTTPITTTTTPTPTTTTPTPTNLLNLNKIKNVIQNEKVEMRNNNNVKVIPIEKKLLLIMKKITTRIESELTKEIINYKLILNKFKKSDNFQNNINAFYYTLLNKIDKSL
jgi:hypothetical protein